MSTMSEVEQLILMTKGLKLHPLEEYIGIRFEIRDSEDICARFTMRDDADIQGVVLYTVGLYLL